MNELARGAEQCSVNTIPRGSVRRKLLVALLLGLVLVWLLGGGISVWQMQDQVRSLLDDNLQQSAAPLLHEVEEQEPDHVFSVFRYSSKLVFQIWRDGERLQLRSKLAPEQRLTQSPPGFSDSVIGGQPWHVFSAWDANHRYLVMVGQPKAERKLIAGKIVEQLVTSLLIVLPLFALMIWFVVGAVLRPLGRLSDEIARRDANNLQPIDGALPREIEPLVRRLNQLLASLDTSLECERRFTADAAHELRTPLAALKSQIQAALGAPERSQQQQALTNALQACDLATHRVEQMLTLTRLDHAIWRETAEIFDLHELAAQVIVEVAPAAARKQVALALESERGILLKAHAGLWAILLRNLLDNAVRYTQPHTNVTVRIIESKDAVELSVEDEGPGIAPAQIEQVFARFERLDRRDEVGSGLGFSIVARIVELHRAHIDLLQGSGGHGLCVRVRIPQTAPSAAG